MTRKEELIFSLERKKIPTKELVELIEIISAESAEADKKNDLNKSITDFLFKLGMPTNLKGFNYIVYGIYLSINSTNNIVKLYDLIAEKYGTTASSAEIAIRHAIATTWKKGNTEYLRELFPYRIPVNTEFINKLSKLLR